MSYKYDVEKQWVFTDEGQRQFLKVREFCRNSLILSGAVMAGKAMCAAGSGDSWKMMSCVDRLVELGEILEIGPGMSPSWQRRVFVNGSLVVE